MDTTETIALLVLIIAAIELATESVRISGTERNSRPRKTETATPQPEKL